MYNGNNANGANGQELVEVRADNGGYGPPTNGSDAPSYGPDQPYRWEYVPQEPEPPPPEPAEMIPLPWEEPAPTGPAPAPAPAPVQAGMGNGLWLVLAVFVLSVYGGFFADRA